MPDWAYVIITVMVLYAGTALQLYRLEKHIEAGFNLVREELALLSGNHEHAAQLRDEWRKDRAKEKRAILLFLMITLGVFGASAGLAWWWFTNREPL